jgi:hypothetical protein
MAFDSRGWRKIVIGDQIFYWQLSDEGLELFRVRPERDPHRLLRITNAGCGRSFGVSGWVTPGNVRGAVECAIYHAWLAGQPRLRLLAFDAPTQYPGFPPIWRYLGLQASWLTTTVVAVAAGIDAEVAFDRMPILADALEEAGCDDADILTHCRASDPHVRGCWVIGLLLDRF